MHWIAAIITVLLVAALFECVASVAKAQARAERHDDQDLLR